MKVLISIFFILISHFTFAKKQTIHIGYFISPPNIICENNCKKPSGAVVDLLEDVYKDSPFVISWERYPFLRLLSYLESGKVDAIALLGKNATRNKIYKYPKKPFHYMQAAIAVHKDSTLKEIKDLDQVNGMQFSFTEKGLVPKPLLKQKINWNNLSRPTFFEKAMMLACRKRIDAIFYPVDIDLQYMISNNSPSCLKLLRLPIAKEPLLTPFSKKSEKLKLAFYEKGLTSILKKKEFKQYLAPYIK
jgi:ABC-type amino acid transport substrate-binding protein